MSHTLKANGSQQVAFFRAYHDDGSAVVDLDASTDGLTLQIYRVAATPITIAALTDKASPTTHVAGSIQKICGNLYALDLPDAATASQVASVVIAGTITGGVIEGTPHAVVGVDVTAPRFGGSAAGDAMTLTPGERDDVAGVVDARLLDAGDATDLIAGIVARVNNTNVDESLLVAAIRNDLERAGGHLQTLIDRPVSPTAAEVAATTAAEVLAAPANKLATDATGRVTTSNLEPGVDHTAELAAIAATQVTIGETLDKIPQVGKTHRWTNAGNGAGFDEITLTEV